MIFFFFWIWLLWVWMGLKILGLGFRDDEDESYGSGILNFRDERIVRIIRNLGFQGEELRRKWIR